MLSKHENAPDFFPVKEPVVCGAQRTQNLLFVAQLREDVLQKARRAERVALRTVQSSAERHTLAEVL